MPASADWIAVLDDSESRVAALRELLPGWKVVHAVRVTSFFRDLYAEVSSRGGQPPRAILLDHDLGIGSFEDIDGNNGMDAAQRLAAGPWAQWYCPVLVWSTNAEAAPRMRQVLVDSGRASVKRSPVGVAPFDHPEEWEPWLLAATVTGG